MTSKRILIVDADPEVTAVLAQMLERTGFEVRRASDEEQALHLLNRHVHYDATLLNVALDGAFVLLDAIRQHHPSLPVLLLTANRDIHHTIDAFRRGAFDVLLTPVHPDDMEDAIARAVEHGRRRRHESAYRKGLEDVIATRTGRLRATMQDLERSYDITLEAMGDALDLRDAETEGHSRRVTAYTIALAQSMGVRVHDLRTIARGAFLHDLGKIATPDSILLKPGRLDPHEVTVMREHCAQGYQIVRKIPFLREASEIVYAHQERFDGAGYPRGLKGDQIPLGARIFAVADTLDAITSDRPYRKGATIAAATEEIARCSGQQFDPAIVEAFLRLPAHLWTELREQVSLLSATQLSHTLTSLPGGRPLTYVSS